MTRTALVGFTVAVFVTGSGPRAQQPAPATANLANPANLVPTNHPRLPRALSQLWLVPENGRAVRTVAETELASAVKLEVLADYARGLPILSQPAVL